jgi:hypothetical protein
MSIQVGIPQSFTYKMKMLPSYSSLFSFLCVMHKISLLISYSCEAYIWLDYTSEQKSQRKEKHKHTLYTGCPFRSVCLCGKAKIRRGEIYQLPRWKLIVDVYSCHGRTDVIGVTLHESDLRTSVIFKQHSELKGSNCTQTVLAEPLVRLLHIVSKFTVWKNLLRWYKHLYVHVVHFMLL